MIKPEELRNFDERAKYNACSNDGGLAGANMLTEDMFPSKAKSAASAGGTLTELDSILGIFQKAIVKDIVGAISGLNILAIICFFCGMGICLKKQKDDDTTREWQQSTVN